MTIHSKIGMTGISGSGKSTAASYLSAEYGYLPRAFADHVRCLVEVLNPTVDGLPLVDQLAIHGGWEGIKKAKPNVRDEVRRLLQVAGTDWGRERNPALWLNEEEYALDQSHPDWWKANGSMIVWQDLRFDNEAVWVRGTGGIVIGVTRPGMLPMQHSAHTSEQGIDPRLVDYWVLNTTLDELHGQLDAIVLDRVPTSV